MSKLIEQFLETHRQCTAQNSVFNISPTLDQEALAIIEQAQAEAQIDVPKGKDRTQPSAKNIQRRLSRTPDSITG